MWLRVIEFIEYYLNLLYVNIIFVLFLLSISYYLIILITYIYIYTFLYNSIY